jgi:hypothetical protein
MHVSGHSRVQRFSRCVAPLTLVQSGIELYSAKHLAQLINVSAQGVIIHKLFLLAVALVTHAIDVSFRASHHHYTSRIANDVCSPRNPEYLTLNILGGYCCPVDSNLGC